MSRPEKETTEAEPDSARDAEEAESTEPRTPPIDQDVAGSVNAALPDTDD